MRFSRSTHLLCLSLVTLMPMIRTGPSNDLTHCKYQVKSHLSPWFSAACATATVHRDQFFCLYNHNKSSESKIKFRRASNQCKRVLESAKLAYANKTMSITFRKIGYWDFWQIANSAFNISKSALSPIFNGQEVLSSASDKA